MKKLHVTLGGEPVDLLPERALFWPRERTLIVADTHFGKAASFRAAAIAVPESAAADLARLTGALERAGATRLALLGDFLHARAGRAPAVLAAIAAWRAAHPRLEVLLVRGNHDARAGDPPAAWDIACVNAPFALGPFALCHHPDTPAPAYVLAGHLHPAVVLTGPGRQRERLPCFLVGPARAILPAFGSFTGHATVSPAADERAYVVADEVIEVQRPGRS
ncbi:MAG: ligase-associated DNA damage response endonuclease PdeM [Chloroflexaceae bacterium]|nr:ligase-associated DNA damage response endonuclease PdeM [Chloroflexaceae bacterium]